MKSRHVFYMILSVFVLFYSCSEDRNPLSFELQSQNNQTLAKVYYVVHYLSNSNDNYTGYDRNEQIFGMGGNDRINGMSGNDYLLGNQGEDILFGNGGEDILRGGKGNDQLYGGQNNDELWGDLGNDYLSGDFGNDKYCYRNGDGSDIIEDKEGMDLLVIFNISQSSVSYSRNGNDLLIHVPGGAIRVKNHYIPNYALERIEFVSNNNAILLSNNANVSIDKIIYTTLPLETNTKETLRITLTEQSAPSKIRKFNIRVYAERPYGTWQIAAANGVTLNANQTTANFYFNVSFNTPGSFYTRVDVYDANTNTLLVSRRGKYPDYINQVSNKKIVYNVPYFFQYYNRINPGGSCQNTSIAMILKYYGANVTPDKISGYYGTSYAQTPEGFASVFNSEAAYFGLSVRDHASRYGRIADIKREIDAGRPVVVHGYFTSYGHVLVVVGYDDQYYYCNDPAGKWSEVYKGGYVSYGPTDGKYVKYRKNAFEDAVAPDGYVWIHRIY